jgi:hypothetical protein
MKQGAPESSGGDTTDLIWIVSNLIKFVANKVLSLTILIFLAADKVLSDADKVLFLTNLI